MAKSRAAAPRPPDARALAWEILQLVDDGGFADALLGTRLDGSGLEQRDQALVTRLVYGTLAWQGYLDHVLSAFSRRPLTELDPPVRAVLRLALFQVCKLARVPDFAAVDTAVELVKRHRGGIAAGFVNAVLRRAVKGWAKVALPPASAPAAHLAVRFSHPTWLVERWLAAYGEAETGALLAADNEPAPTVLRVNVRRGDRAALLAELTGAGYAAAPTAFSPLGIRLDNVGSPSRIPGIAAGLCSVQGEASQLVGLLAGVEPGQRVLDACAAPGGKTTHLAELLDDRGELLALDPNATGLERLAAQARRLGLAAIHTVPTDAVAWVGAHADASGAPPRFDCVLVDAPCTGLGTLRAHPEVRWRRTPDDVAALAVLQRRLLERLADCVRPGGTLVYATCTLSAEENEDNVTAFLRERSEFAIDDARRVLPAGAAELVSGDGILRTFPHRHGLDGFFAVRLVRHAAT